MRVKIHRPWRQVLFRFFVPHADTIGQSGAIGKCDMDIGELCAICGACVTEVLVVTGELSDPDVEYVIGVPCVVCELSATDELFDIVPAIAGLAVLDVGLGTDVIEAGYGVDGGGSGDGGSCGGNGGLHAACPLELGAGAEGGR